MLRFKLMGSIIFLLLIVLVIGGCGLGRGFNDGHLHGHYYSNSLDMEKQRTQNS